MLSSLRNNPVRLFAAATAALALVAHYVPDLPTALVLALVATLLGVGEGVRYATTPNAQVAATVAQVPEGHVLVPVPAPPAPTP